MSLNISTTVVLSSQRSEPAGCRPAGVCEAITTEVVRGERRPTGSPTQTKWVIHRQPRPRDPKTARAKSPRGRDGVGFAAMANPSRATSTALMVPPTT